MPISPKSVLGCLAAGILLLVSACRQGEPVVKDPVVVGHHAGDKVVNESAVLGDYCRRSIVNGALELHCGAECILADARYYISDKDWGLVFPSARTQAFSTKREGSFTTCRSIHAEGGVSATITYAHGVNSVTMAVDAIIPAPSKCRFAVFDALMSRPQFENAVVRLKDGSTRRLDPKTWVDLPFESVSITVPYGEWQITATSSNAIGWRIRSLCDRAWGPPQHKTFSIIHLNELTGNEMEAVREQLSLEMRLIPNATAAACLDDGMSKLSSAYFLKQLKEMGVEIPERELPSMPAERATRLADVFCASTAGLDDSGLDRRHGIVIPEPRQRIDGSGLFHVPAAVGIACNARQQACYDLLATDLARHDAYSMTTVSGRMSPLDVAGGLMW